VARNIKEIKNFNAGTVSNADPRETPEDAPILSYNVDGNGPGGILRARNKDIIKGGIVGHSSLKLETGLTVDPEINIDVPATNIPYRGDCDLIIGDYISIDTETMLIEDILQVTSNIGQITVARGQLGTSITEHDAGSDIYRNITPVSTFTYASEDDGERENAVIISKNGWVDGIYDIKNTLFVQDVNGNDTDTAIDTVGSGINDDLTGQGLTSDFSAFPRKILQNGNPSIVENNNIFFIGCGSGNKTKWIGRVKKANISGKSGFLVEDDELKNPLQGSASSTYDKILTYQHHFSSEAQTDMNVLNNTTKALHIGYKKGTDFLTIMNADDGRSFVSSSLPFTVDNICKCVSAKNSVKVWVYSKGSQNTIENIGRIYLVSIPNLNVTDVDDSATINNADGVFSNSWTPEVHKTVNIHLAGSGSVPTESVDNSKDYGYESIPFYRQGKSSHPDSDGDEYTGGQEISDILETVDGSGKGKLWILASPLETDDEDPDKNWFRVTPKLPIKHNDDYDDFCSFRFLWCSYERSNENITHIEGDIWADGGEVDIYFNDKSFSMLQLDDCHRTTDRNSHAVMRPTWKNTSQHRVFYRFMKRQVPTPGATTYIDTSSPVSDQDNLWTDGGSGSDYNSTSEIILAQDTTGPEDIESSVCLVHGGGPWYKDTRPIGGTDNHPQPVEDNDRIQWSVLSAEGTGWVERTAASKTDNPNSYFPWYHENCSEIDVQDNVIFKPLPNSLVDLSDLYKVPNADSADGTMSHIVGCFVNFHKGYKLEDMWIHGHTPTSVPSDKSMAYGRRIRKVSGTSCLWISSGNLENYGANYVRNNSFGYNRKGGDGESTSDYNQYDIIGMSTTCLNTNESEGGTVRLYKWLPFQLPNKLTNVLRNKILSEFNCGDEDGEVSWVANTNDNDPRYSSLFLSFDKEESIEDSESGISNFGAALKLNTTLEYGDKDDALVDDNTVAVNGLCGYTKNTNTTNTISNTSGNATKEANPQNSNAVFSKQTYGENSIDMGDSFRFVGVNQTGSELAASAKHVEDVVPQGPFSYGFFGKCAIDTNGSNFNSPHYNFFHKIPANGRTIVSVNQIDIGNQLFPEEGALIKQNTPAFILNNFSQSVFLGNTAGNLVTGGGTFGTTSLGHTSMYTLEAQNNSLAASSFGKLQDGESEETSPEETNALMIGHIWPKGNPGGKFGNEDPADVVDASASTARSKYEIADYHLSIFNKGGTKSAFYCTLTDELDFTPTVTNEFLNCPTEADNPNSNKLSIYAESKHQEASSLSNISFTGVETAHPSGDDTQSYYDYFPKQTNKFYKLSYEYDGFQDSPLTAIEFVYFNPATDYRSIDVTIVFPADIPARATRINLWRKNEVGGDYYKVGNSVKLKEGLLPGVLSGKSVYTVTIRDKGADSQGASFLDYTGGMHQNTRHNSANYGISAKANGYLFAADVSHPDIEDKGKTTILRSLKNKYSSFVVSNENKITVDSEITSMQGYNGKLYVFTNTSTIRVNPESFTEEDVLHGFGCSSKDGVIVTEYGMFYADKNHIYMHDGSTAKIISYPIENDDFSGKSLGWKDFASSGNYKALFISKTNQIGFAVNKLDSTSTYTHTYIFAYHVLKQRWDLKKLCSQSSDEIISYNSNLEFIESKVDGTIYYFTNATVSSGCSMIWELEAGDKNGYQWISKTFSLDADTVDKRFVKVKIEASGTISTPTIYIDGTEVSSDNISSVGATSGAGTYEYKILGSSKKGKSLKIAWGDGTLNDSTDEYNSSTSIYSIGVIYRMGKIK
jgi:hypothetical protein